MRTSLLLTSVALVLSACGSGGSDGSSAADGPSTLDDPGSSVVEVVASPTPPPAAEAVGNDESGPGEPEMMEGMSAGEPSSPEPGPQVVDDPVPGPTVPPTPVEPTSGSTPSEPDESAPPEPVTAEPTDLDQPLPSPDPQAPPIEGAGELESPPPGSSPAADPELEPTSPTESPAPVAGPPALDTPISMSEAPEPTGSALPGDCLSARSDDGIELCYTRTTRELIALRADGSSYWRFTLPGNDDVNDIVSVAFAQERFVILAATSDAAAGRNTEFSTFETAGAFIDTFPIPTVSLLGGRGLVSTEMALFGTARALYLSGALEASTTPTNVVSPDSVLVRIDARNGRLEAVRGTSGDRTRELTDPAGPDAPLATVREGAPEGIDPWLLAPATTSIVTEDTWRTLVLWAERWGSAAFLDEAFEAAALVRAGRAPADGQGPYERCPDGGSVAYEDSTTSLDGQLVGSDRYRYDECRDGSATLDGVVQTDSAGSRNFSETRTRWESVSIRRADPPARAVTGSLNWFARYETPGVPCISFLDTYGLTIDAIEIVDADRSFSVSQGYLSGETNQPNQYINDPSLPGGPGCVPGPGPSTASSSASLTVRPPFDPSGSLRMFVSDDDGERVLEVRSDDGSFLELRGALDGVSVDRLVIGRSSGGRFEQLVRVSVDIVEPAFR